MDSTTEIDKTIVDLYLEYFGEGKTETLWFIRALLNLLAFCFTIISVSGFGIYLWYLNSNATNTSRLLNNLYGFAALGGIFISPLWFIHLICVQIFGEGHLIFYGLYIIKIFFGSLGSIIIIMILVWQQYSDISNLKSIWTIVIGGVTENLAYLFY